MEAVHNRHGDDLLEIRGLSVEFPMFNGTIHAVNQVDFTVPRYSVTALVGESGSGKSTMASAILNMVSAPGRITEGEILVNGKDILAMDKRELRTYKWETVAMVFQAAQNSLNPLFTIREQMLETIQVHRRDMAAGEAEELCVKLLEYVRLDAGRVLGCYPHELSGGMKQRVMIAFSMLLSPQMIILDEPSTALDVITQDYIFDILAKIHKEMDLTMLLLTHDIAIVAKVAERMCVMYAGDIVESGDVYTIFQRSAHAYTKELIGAAPSLLGGLEERAGSDGSPPDLICLPQGCAFYPRCKDPLPQCQVQKPPCVDLGGGHHVKCHRFAKEGAV